MTTHVRPGGAGPRRAIARATALAWLIAFALTAVVGVTMSGATTPDEAAFASHVSESRLRATVKALAALGPRMGGTPSGDASAAAIAAAFRAAGALVDIVDDPPVSAYWAERWEVRIDAGADRLSSAWPFLHAVSVDPPRSAPLVFVPSLAEPGPGDWEGKVVYTRESSPSALARVRRGPAPPVAILTSAPHHEGRYTDWASLGALPAGPGRGVPVLALSYADGLRAEAAARRGATVTVGLVSHVRQAPPKTVLAHLSGGGSRGYYLITAHADSDSGGPGADDNASGVAVLVELAHVLAELTRGGRLAGLPFGVRFAAWGAEYHSARAFAAREGDRLSECLGVVNIDQAGAGAEREAVYFEGNDVPWNEALLRLFEQVGRDYRGREGYWPEFVTTPSQGGTDAYVFLPPAYKGQAPSSLRLPAVTVYTAAWDELRRLPQTPGWEADVPGPVPQVTIDYSAYYHSSGDTPENTTEREPQNMVRVTKAIGLALLRLAESTQPEP